MQVGDILLKKKGQIDWWNEEHGWLWKIEKIQNFTMQGRVITFFTLVSIATGYKNDPVMKHSINMFFTLVAENKNAGG